MYRLMARWLPSVDQRYNSLVADRCASLANTGKQIMHTFYAYLLWLNKEKAIKKLEFRMRATNISWTLFGLSKSKVWPKSCQNVWIDWFFGWIIDNWRQISDSVIGWALNQDLWAQIVCHWLPLMGALLMRGKRKTSFVSIAIKFYALLSDWYAFETRFKHHFHSNQPKTKPIIHMRCHSMVAWFVSSPVRL